MSAGSCFHTKRCIMSAGSAFKLLPDCFHVKRYGASCRPDHVVILRGASCRPDHVFMLRGASCRPDHVFILRGASCQPDQR